MILLCYQRMALEAAKIPADVETSGGFSSNLNDRVSNLEARNSFQMDEIAFLKTTVNQLMSRVATLEASAGPSAGSHDVVIG